MIGLMRGFVAVVGLQLVAGIFLLLHSAYVGWNR